MGSGQNKARWLHGIGGRRSEATNEGRSKLSHFPVDRAFPEAVKWYRLAADQGNSGAQYALGVKYADGEGVPKTTSKHTLE